VNCSGEEPFISSGYNLEDADSCNFNQATDLPNITDPKLDVLADNGGQTLTYALLPGSPAIDGADSGQCTATDQRGAPRPVNGDGVPPTGCDIGAFELGGPPEAAVSADSSFYFLPATLNH
jgi:hypothetical protein